MLINTMPLHARAWQEALKPRGYRVLRRTIYEWEGEPGAVTAHTLLRREGTAPSRRAAAALLQDKERRFSRLARRIRVNPSLRELLNRLSRRGIRLGLVTGTSSREICRLVPQRVLAKFSVVVTGDRVRHGKPHPEPYLTALRQLRVSPRRAIIVENAPYGIRSALASRAGLVIALASSLPRRCLREAHLIVTSVRQLSALLDQLTR